MTLDDKVELIRLMPRGQLHVFIQSGAGCGARQGHVSHVTEVTAGSILSRRTPGVCVGCRYVIKRELNAHD